MTRDPVAPEPAGEGGQGVSGQSVLAVFAHPDDAELGCFGTLASLREVGFGVHIVSLTSGSSSSSPHAAWRTAEAKESASVIGANLVIENFVDGGLELKRETYACVAEHLSRTNPSVVITHMTGAQDHQDHETAGMAALTMAGRCTGVKLILQTEPPLMNNLFCPNFYVDITGFMPHKLAAVGQYVSERGKPYVAEQAIRDRATWWARQAETHEVTDTRYYEAFRMTKAKLYPQWLVPGLSAPAQEPLA